MDGFDGIGRRFRSGGVGGTGRDGWISSALLFSEDKIDHPTPADVRLVHIATVGQQEFCVAPSAVSAPARFNCTRSRVTSGFFSCAGTGDENATRPTGVSAIREPTVTTLRASERAASRYGADRPRSRAGK